MFRVTVMNRRPQKNVPRVTVALFICCTLMGCATTAPVTISPRQQEANRHNDRGIAAEARGDHSLALEEFSRSVQGNGAVENSTGIVVALVNSSRACRHKGDFAAAQALMTRAVALVPPPHGLSGEVAFEMAQVKLHLNGPTDALPWAEQAVSNDHSSQRGMRLNLLGRILLAQGKTVEAEVTVREALELNREQAFRSEEANSLRLLGDLHFTGGRFQSAADSFDRALTIDKELGSSGKIAADLRGLARSAESAHDDSGAIAYYGRACAVSSAAGDLAGAASDLLILSRIHHRRGENERAEQMLAEREQLLKKLR